MKRIRNVSLIIILLSGGIAFFTPNQAFSAIGPSPASITEQQNFYKKFYDTQKPAIVYIRSEIDPTKIKPKNDEEMDEKKMLPPIFKYSITIEELGLILSYSLGTGFFISNNGEILTNHHVIEDSLAITVLTADGTAYIAEVIGANKEYDLALLKIKADRPAIFPFLELGDAIPTAEAEPVVVIGNPFGLGWTLSVGYISAPKRLSPSPPYIYIQINCSINQGNSGSPLMTLDGKVIGVVQSMASSDVGFAIAVNIAKSLLP